MVSKIGLVLCGFYAFVLVCCLILRARGNIDNKSRFVFWQMPVAFQISLLQRLGLNALLQKINSWLGFFLICLVTFVFLYLTGMAIGMLPDVVQWLMGCLAFLYMLVLGAEILRTVVKSRISVQSKRVKAVPER